ncbi:hypothetical protein BDW59DRAFT_166540 [Aspergillus cavernicola]|uniref:Uncharacterized protein n=1 Tax=Aspergillus cavernicola TaxID=176166 RepID=A0ABR4HLD8_9EURO
MDEDEIISCLMRGLSLSYGPHQDFVNPPHAPGNLPDSIKSAEWMKREVARSILNKEMPLSAICQAGVVADCFDDMDASSEPLEPTVASDHSITPLSPTTASRSDRMFSIIGELNSHTT